jgi:CO/xanthine dehydrogenase FAD-binding subunit
MGWPQWRPMSRKNRLAAERRGASIVLYPFDYHRPTDLPEALEYLRHHSQALPLAGGTDLLVKIRRKKVSPAALLDIKGLDVCRGIVEEDHHLSVGSLTTFQQLLESDIIRDQFPVLHQAAQVMGCYEIRRRATLGGNVVNASPGAEAGSPLAVLEALVELAGSGGRRRVPVIDFWQGPGRTALAPGELLVRILLPKLPPGSRGTYLRCRRVRGMDLASLNVAVAVIHPHVERDREVRIAMGAVAPTPVRAVDIEQMLRGQRLDERLLGRLREEISRGLNPRVTSLRASPEYKKRMVGVLTQMALGQLFADRNDRKSLFGRGE